MFLSSHLLDEVEKICDAAAIVDRGRVIATGTIAELSADDGHTILIGCSDPQAALALLQGQPGVVGVERLADGLRVRANSTDRPGGDQRLARPRGDPGVAS